MLVNGWSDVDKLSSQTHQRMSRQICKLFRNRKRVAVTVVPHESTSAIKSTLEAKYKLVGEKVD